MKTPHVLHVICELNPLIQPRGIESYLFDLIENMRGSFYSTVVYPCNNREGPFFFGHHNFMSELRVSRDERLYTGKFEGFPSDLTCEQIEGEFLNIVKSGDYDIIHFHHLGTWGTFVLPKIIKKETKLPVVWTLHDYFLLCPRWSLLFKNKSPCGKKRADGADSECLDCLGISMQGAPLENMSRYLNERWHHLREVVAHADRMIAPSHFVRRQFKTAFGESVDSKLRIIPHGVRTAKISVRPGPSDKLRVAFLGNLFMVKGAGVYLEAVRLLQDKPLVFHLFGEICFSLEPQVRKINLIRHGRYERNELPKLLSQIDVVVIPSLAPETFCLTLSEAQAAGVPVIASDIGAIPERIEHGKTGFLFPVGDAQALSKLLLEVRERPQVLDYVRKNLETRGVNMSTNSAKDHEKIYFELLGSQGKA